jgi:hypothetical protein
MKGDREVTQIRIPKTLYKEVKKAALETGISRNDALLMFIESGIALRKNRFNEKIK